MAKSRFLLGLVSIFLFCFVVSSVFAAGSDDAQVAQVAINSAESRMSSVYKSVLVAENEGSNVSSLLVKLNTSASLLSMAQMQNRTGNFIEAASLANQCYDSLNEVEIEANNLRDIAVTERNQKVLISVVGSSIVIGAILFAGVFGWRFFKEKYSKRVLGMKPEVQANDTE